MNGDVNVRRNSYTAAREIKASAHYSYVVNGITLDGSKFAANELVTEGQCLVMDNVTKKYEKYTETTPGTFEPGKSNPVILDESVRITVKDDASNADATAGEVLVHGAVYAGMLVGATTKFKEACKGITFVE